MYIDNRWFIGKPRRYGDLPPCYLFLWCGVEQTPQVRGSSDSRRGRAQDGHANPAGTGILPPKRHLITVVDTFELPPQKGRGSPKAKNPPVRKPPGKPKVSKPCRKAVPKASEPERRPAPTPVEAESSRQRLLEHARLQAQEHRRKAKAQGLCRDCLSPSIPDQTRCSPCASQHREQRREQRRKTKERNAQNQHQASGQI